MAQLNAWAGIIADWASIVSLLVSIYAAVTITRVRREIVGRATLPAITAALENSVRIMTDLLVDVEANWRAVELELAKCEANLRAVSAAKSAAAPRAHALLTSIASLRRQSSRTSVGARESRTDEAWRVYASLTGMIEELKRISLWHQIGG